LTDPQLDAELDELVTALLESEGWTPTNRLPQ
jgi:hypothetical protein